MASSFSDSSAVEGFLLRSRSLSSGRSSFSLRLPSFKASSSSSSVSRGGSSKKKKETEESLKQKQRRCHHSRASSEDFKIVCPPSDDVDSLFRISPRRGGSGSIRNWILSRLSLAPPQHRVGPCIFSAYIQSVHGLPLHFEGLSVLLHLYYTEGAEARTLPSRISLGSAQFGDTLHIKSSLTKHACKELEFCLLALDRYSNADENSNESENEEYMIGKHRIDLTSLLPTRAAKRLNQPWTRTLATRHFQMGGREAPGAVVVASLSLEIPHKEAQRSPLIATQRSDSARFQGSLIGRVLHDLNHPSDSNTTTREAFYTNPLLNSSLMNQTEAALFGPDNLDSDTSLNLELCPLLSELSLSPPTPKLFPRSLHIAAESSSSSEQSTLDEESDNRGGEVRSSFAMAYPDSESFCFGFGSDSAVALHQDKSLIITDISNSESNSPKSRLLKEVEEELLRIQFDSPSPRIKSRKSFDEELGGSESTISTVLCEPGGSESTISTVSCELGGSESTISTVSCELTNEPESNAFLFLDSCEKEMQRAYQTLKSRARAKLLDDAETKALMQEWGLDEKAFEISPLKPTHNNGLWTHSLPVAPLLPDVLASFLTLKDVEALRGMNYEKLLMHLSNPSVIPPRIGSSALEILENMVSKAFETVPPKDVSGETTPWIGMDRFYEDVQRLSSSSGSNNKEDLPSEESH